MKKIIAILFIISYFHLNSHSVRIKDIVRFESGYFNNIIGYGLVSGLNGTGDRSIDSTNMSLSNMLLKFGISVTPKQIKSRNVAGVMVIARLPDYPYPGQKIDVEVSSIGDAISLDGGTLLRTPLYDKDGKIVAIAQGMITTGKKKTSGIISSGGEIISEYFENRKEEFSLFLNKPDYKTAVEIEKIINSSFNDISAKAIDSSKVTVKYSTSSLNFAAVCAKIGDLNVNFDSKARVVINSISGDVVISGKVEILPCSLSVGDIDIEIGARDEIKNNIISVKGTDISELLKALKSINVKPSQIVEIIKTLNAAGLISGEVEII